MWDEDVEGDVAEVYQSLVEPIRFVGAPYQLGIGNAAFAFVMIFGAYLWYWIAIGLIIHLSLWLTTRRDIYAADQLREYCQYAYYFGVH